MTSEGLGEMFEGDSADTRANITYFLLLLVESSHLFRELASCRCWEINSLRKTNCEDNFFPSIIITSFLRRPPAVANLAQTSKSVTHRHAHTQIVQKL